MILGFVAKSNKSPGDVSTPVSALRASLLNWAWRVLGTKTSVFISISIRGSLKQPGHWPWVTHSDPRPSSSPMLWGWSESWKLLLKHIFLEIRWHLSPLKTVMEQKIILSLLSLKNSAEFRLSQASSQQWQNIFLWYHVLPTLWLRKCNLLNSPGLLNYNHEYLKDTLFCVMKQNY